VTGWAAPADADLGDVDVLVPTCDRPVELATTLAGLAAPRSGFGLVVSDQSAGGPAWDNTVRAGHGRRPGGARLPGAPAAKVISAYPPFALVEPDNPEPPADVEYPFWLKPVKSSSSDLAFEATIYGVLDSLI
jgi:hypothetical protein